MTPHDPTSYSDLTQGKIKHIDFYIQVDFDSRTLDIEATYQMDAPVHGFLYLDTFKIEIKEAHVNGRSLEWEFDAHDETKGERLHLKGFEGDASFTLKVKTSPEARALQWMKASQTAGGKHPFLFSQCQANNARSIFPCQDTPSVRFTYSAEVEVPKELTAVMAAEQAKVPALSRSKDREESGMFIFNMPQPIPSYLFAIAVANLTSREFGPLTGIYAEPEVIDAAAWEFAETEKTLIEAEKLLGPYLWGRYDLLVLPPSFPFGGMENPRLTFLTPTAITGTRGQASLVTHELAHAWTGNLVTNATWQDFWLNEGWTTYAETRITEILEGRDVTDLNAVYDERRIMEAINLVGADSPFTRLKVPSDAGEGDTFTAGIPYVKGSFFLKECEYAVGRERFDEFIQKYMKRFQFQSLTTEEFLEFLNAELPDVFEKVDVQTWVYKPGMPEAWHKPQSHLYDEVERVLADFRNGKLPTKQQAQGWHRYQILSFLQGLPNTISVEECKQLEDILELEKRNDDLFLSYFYALATASGYNEVMPRVEQFVEKIGRLLYLMPVARALTEADWTRDQARALFERVREKQHPVTVAAIERLLRRADL
jgi:aminopeptidase N